MTLICYHVADVEQLTILFQAGATCYNDTDLTHSASKILADKALKNPVSGTNSPWHDDTHLTH
jgi:hypothetical protein